MQIISKVNCFYLKQSSKYYCKEWVVFSLFFMIRKLDIFENGGVFGTKRRSLESVEIYLLLLL